MLGDLKKRPMAVAEVTCADCSPSAVGVSGETFASNFILSASGSAGCDWLEEGQSVWRLKVDNVPPCSL